MISRTARSLSRQALPRPARLYTATNRVNAPALATQQLPQPEYPPWLKKGPQHPSRPVDEERILNDLERFLHRDRDYTVLPPPPPMDAVKKSDAWFGDTSTQESISIMDACLHNLHDVERAKIIFKQLREKETSMLLETGVYNAFIQAYFGMAVQKDVNNVAMWLDEIHDLYHILEDELEHSAPNMMTYGIMLHIWQRMAANASPFSQKHHLNLPSPTALLEKMVQRKISPTLVVADTVFNTSEDATDAIKILSQAAVNLNIPDVISELGQAEAIATSEDLLKDVPEIMPVLRPAKFDADGNIIAEAEVPFNIIQLRRHLTEVQQTRRVLPEDVMARQKHLEKSAYDVALERLQQQAEKMEELGVHNPALNHSTLQKWMWDWHVKLRERLTVEIKKLQAGDDMTRPVDGKRADMVSPYLTLVKAERLSLITILELMRLQGSSGLSDGMKTTRALISVGKSVEMEYKAQLCKKNQINVTPQNQGGRASDIYSQLGYRNLQERRIAVAKNMMDGEDWSASWSQATRSKIGGILVDCLMEVAEVTRTAVCKKTGETISEEQPAFHHAYEYLRGNKLGVIRLNPVVTERLAKDQLKDTLHPRHLPMLVKPQPWISHNIGGYLYSKTAVMRYKDSLEQQVYLKEASKNGQFELVYAGLDVLGSTPWRINRNVFDVVIQVWNSGDRLGKLPPAVYDKPEPVPPENYEIDMKARSVYIQRQRGYNQAKANNHSERCSVNYRLEIARALLNDAFYFPHNLDFRGRAYPVPAHLNHIGDDLCRGLLTFDESKPLGERGLRWLKIHVANLYGYDKANFDDRVKWVDEHIAQIYETATKPMDGSKWWLSAGDPWQFLAASFELHAALESGDPYSYKSSLPVHQDGTCNGLQHYAALGGDSQGAQQVNLAASDKPSDVYSYVGRMVEEVIERDIEKGEKYAMMLKGKITRKVVKQTVMTTVYGVTFIGARDQIEKQLKDRKDIDEEECWPAAAYLAKVVLSCIGDLFTGAKAIQNWLNLCARLISKSIPEERIPEVMEEYIGKQQAQEKADAIEAETLKAEAEAQITSNDIENPSELGLLGKAGRPKKSKAKKARVGAKVDKRKLPMQRLKKEQMTSVIWTTPLGLPIVQPYRKTARKQVMTAVQTVYISDPNSLAEVNAVKQASAFPPNFIHSLDATHMMLTALECRKRGLTFASVHDSYWTHAADIDEMSGVIRDTFIALHSSDVLGELHREFLQRYKNFKVPLINLTGSSMGLKLAQAGSKIYATPEQVVELGNLGGLKDIVFITEEKEGEMLSTVDESRAVKDAEAVKKLLEDLEKEGAVTGSKKSTKMVAFDDEVNMDMDMDMDAEVDMEVGMGMGMGMGMENGVKSSFSSSSSLKGKGKEEIIDETEPYQARVAREKKEQQKQAIVKLMGKFVNLVDLFPPVPKKGEFDVGAIKESQYFFS